MIACPNKNSEQWVQLTGALGENEAYRAWLRNKGAEFTPQEAAYQMFLDDNTGLASAVLSHYIPYDKSPKQTLSMSSLDVIRLADQKLFSDDVFLTWAKDRNLLDKLQLEKTFNKWPEESMEPVQNEDPFTGPLSYDERNYENVELDRDGFKTARANEIARKLADKLSENLGVNYSIVTREEAEDILGGTQTPYNGQSAFFFGGQAYFVSDRIGTEDVLHEFAHPLIRAISQENRTLFDNLYKAIEASPENQKLVEAIQSAYPDLDKNSDLYKEEVIVHALERAAQNQLTGEPASKNFLDFLKNIFYALKQLLRKLFGREVQLDQLSPLTTLDQLARMLQSDKFHIDTEMISDEDIAAYRESLDRFMNDLKDVDKADILKVINRFYDVASRQIDVIRQNPKNFSEIRDLLVSAEGTGLLSNIKRQLRPHQTVNVKNSSEVEEALTDIQREMAQVQRQANALVVSTLTLQEIATRIVKELSEINKSPEADSQSAMGKVFYYDYLLRYWKEFIDEAKLGLTDANVPATADVYKLISGIEGLVEQGVRITNQVYKKGSSKFVESQLKFMQDEIDRIYSERRETINKKAKDETSKQSQLAKLEQEYNKVKIDRERITRILEGKEGDMNQFNAFLEGFMSANDPVIGGFATFLKNALTDVDNKAQAESNRFMREIEPLLKSVGYNPTNIAKLGSEVSFTDTVGYVDKDGILQKRQVYTFLNPFKDYRYDIAEARHKFEKAKETGDRVQIAQAAKDLRTLNRNYFHQEYVQEYYDLQKVFETPVGQEAWLDRQEILEKISLHSGVQFTEYEEFQSYDETSALWREYAQLYSLMNPDGSPKTGRELEKAVVLREYREKSRKFFAEPNWQAATNNFETALNSFENQIEATEGVKRGTPEFDGLVQKWIRRNSRIVYDESWYKERNRIMTRIKEITSGFDERIREQLDISKSWEEIVNIVYGFRDEDGQPVGSDLKADQVKKIKLLQQAIRDAQQSLAGYTGLTQEEMDEFSGYMEMLQNGVRLDESQSERFHYLSTLKNTLGLSDMEKTELIQLFQELREIQHGEPTSYYLDHINYWMGKLEEGSVDESNADDILKEDEANRLMAKDKEFRAWFEANHVRKKVYDKASKEHKDKWERLYSWSIIKPNNNKYLRSMTLKRTDSAGKPVEIFRLPSNRFYSRQVKKEYKTPRVIGITVDNQGNWLPRMTTTQEVKGVTLTPASSDSPYINEAYFELKRKNPEMFKLLEALTENHLRFQGSILYGEEGQRPEGEERAAPRNSRLYLDLPRFRKENLEYIQSGGLKKTAKEKVDSLTSVAKGFRDFFRKSPDDYQHGMSYDPKDNFKLARADMFDDEIVSIPIAGLYNLDLDQTSLNVLESMHRYMLSIQKQKKLIEINPIAQAMRQVINNPDNAIKDLTRVNKFHYQHRNEIRFLNKKGRNVRAGAFNALYNREFLGETNIGFGDQNPGITKVMNWLMHKASFGFFALNLPSAIKNRWGQMLQNTIEMAGGKTMSPQSFALGRVWSAKAMMEYSAKDLYKRGPKGLNTQVIEIFDPVQGRFEEKFGSSTARTITKDIASMTWFYSPRKFMEVEAVLQLFGGMMHHQYVDQELPDGSKRQMRYIDAWELDKQGQIKLKDGISKEWAQGGEKFKAFRNMVQETANHLNGAYAKFDQPDAQRYMLFRVAAFMRKYFTSMFINRFGFSTSRENFGGYRYNWGLGTMHRGFYVTSLAAISKLMLTFGKHWMYMTQEEKRAVRKLSTELVSLYAIQALLPLLFGWDPDDPDRYAKLRAKSGALGADDFETDGYLSNHLLNLMLQVRSENEQFVPLPGYGLDSYMQFKNLTSVVFGPTVDTYSKILNDLWMMSWGDERAYYKKDMGPYPWQKNESAKLWNHIGAAFGVTGSSVDPVKAIQGFQGIQARYR